MSVHGQDEALGGGAGKAMTGQLSNTWRLMWGLGGIFRESGYYRTSKLADGLGKALSKVLPWPFNFMTLVIARK